MIPLRLVSNVPRLESALPRDGSVIHEDLTLFMQDGMLGALRHLARGQHVLLVDDDSALLWRLCLLRWLTPFLQWRLISMDILLPRPVDMAQQVRARVQSLLLRAVDRFILYFRDLDGYARHYGIRADRVAYVAFKSAAWDEGHPAAGLAVPPDTPDQFVLTAGRTKRDLSTFLRAMALVRIPGVLLHQPSEVMAAHGSAVPDMVIPPNVRLVPHDGGRGSWLDKIARSRLVVIPTLASTISSTGISTCFDAMALNRCVIMTEGPATRGLLTNEAIIVPPSDPEALAAAIQRAWEDRDFRVSTSERGLAYARASAGEGRFLAEVLAAALADAPTARPRVGDA